MSTSKRFVRLSLAAVLVSSCFASLSYASSHREAPRITATPKVDATDFYIFNSYEAGREDYVTLVANYMPLQDAYGGPNYFAFDPNALYEIHVDNDGDAEEDLTFQFQFAQALGSSGEGIALDIAGVSVPVPLKAVGPLSAADTSAANFAETYNVTLVQGDRRTGVKNTVTLTQGGGAELQKPFDYVGENTFGDATQYEAYLASLTASGEIYNDVTFTGCPANAAEGRVFVGQRKDSFAVNLGSIFDLVNFDPLNITDDVSNDQLADKNVSTIAIEVHKDCLTGNGNGVIGAWTAASLPQVSVINPTATFADPAVQGGAWTQVSRLSNPLVNEVVIGLPDKDLFNSSEPAQDGQFANYVTNPTLPAILNLLFNSGQEFGVADIAPQNFPRQDLIAAFLTGVAGVNQLMTVTPSEMLRLNTGVPATASGSQANLGIAAGDLAGFPNGRRPGDDVVDIALRAMMGAFCHAIPVDLNGDETLDDQDNLLLCGTTPEDSSAQAPAGTAGFLDGAPQNEGQFMASFPYLTTPIAGASN